MTTGSTLPRATTHRPPTGARDLLPLDVVQKQWVESVLSQRFERWGYHRIITPTLERLETLTAGGSIQPDSLLQLRDAEGSVLGLRPELTASIVRAAATRMSDAPLPLRLFYHGNVFRNAQREQEFFQTGVELIGAGGWLADLEVVLLLCDGLRSLNLPAWQLIVGDVGVTEALLNLISDTARPRIRQAITQLDRVYLQTAPLSDLDRHIALQILELRGQPTKVIPQLEALDLPDPQRHRLQALQRLCDRLIDQEVPFLLDLSLLQSFSYYTGLVFKVICGIEEIGSGGRYDDLFGIYSPSHTQQPGIGFMLRLEKLQQWLQPTLPQTLESSSKLIVPADEQAIPAAIHLAQKWRHSDPVELELLARDEADAVVYAQTRGIREVVRVEADGSFHRIVIEDGFRS